jgi:hypothetical protein
MKPYCIATLEDGATYCGEPLAVIQLEDGTIRRHGAWCRMHLDAFLSAKDGRWEIWEDNQWKRLIPH